MMLKKLSVIHAQKYNDLRKKGVLNACLKDAEA
jgi:hypothetical protein